MTGQQEYKLQMVRNVEWKHSHIQINLMIFNFYNFHQTLEVLMNHLKPWLASFAEMQLSSFFSRFHSDQANGRGFKLFSPIQIVKKELKIIFWLLIVLIADYEWKIVDKEMKTLCKYKMVPCTVMGDIISTHKVICSLNIKDFWIFSVKIFKIAEYTLGATFEDIEMCNAVDVGRNVWEPNWNCLLLCCRSEETIDHWKEILLPSGKENYLAITYLATTIMY